MRPNKLFKNMNNADFSNQYSIKTGKHCPYLIFLGDRVNLSIQSDIFYIIGVKKMRLDNTRINILLKQYNFYYTFAFRPYFPFRHPDKIIFNIGGYAFKHVIPHLEGKNSKIKIEYLTKTHIDL